MLVVSQISVVCRITFHAWPKWASGVRANSNADQSGESKFKGLWRRSTFGPQTLPFNLKPSRSLWTNSWSNCSSFFHLIQKLFVSPNHFTSYLRVESYLGYKNFIKNPLFSMFFHLFHFLHLVNYNSRETNHHLCITQSITHPTFCSEAHQPIPIAF